MPYVLVASRTPPGQRVREIRNDCRTSTIMRALLLKEYKLREITEMPEPAVGPDDVLVRVKACGICGSDVHGYGQTARKSKARYWLSGRIQILRNFIVVSGAGPLMGPSSISIVRPTTRLWSWSTRGPS